MNTLDRFREAFEERTKGDHLRGIRRVMGGVQGWSSGNILAAIGAAVEVSGAGYLEVGCMNGLTLCGAMVGNEDRLFVGVDDFSQFGLRDVLMGNVGAVHPGITFHFYELDYQDFFEAHARRFQGRLGCYFYDADHAYEHQKRGLELGAESGVLASEAFMAVDDYSWMDTKRAVEEFLAAHPEWEVVLEEEDDWNQRGWWNGLVVLYREQVGAMNARPKEAIE
jgi:hypothetical protein